MTAQNPELIERIILLAEEAGAAILDVYENGDMDVKTKEDDSPLTRADIAANSIIVEGLGAITGEVPILSEESRDVPHAERSYWQTFFLVDPLDGTKEFIKKNGEFTVNIALVEDTRAVLGVVHAPVLGVTYYGCEGEGSFKRDMKKEGDDVAISVTPYVSGPLKVVASRSHRGDELDAFLAKVGESECISKGSSLKLCLVAEGSAHLYPRLGPTMEWDTAAAQCVVECAGGMVTDLERRPLKYNKKELLNPFFMVSAKEGGFEWWKYL